MSGAGGPRHGALTMRGTDCTALGILNDQGIGLRRAFVPPPQQQQQVRPSTACVFALGSVAVLG